MTQLRSISIDAAVVVTRRSKSTIWRRVAEGSIRRLDPDGRRAMLVLEDVEPLIDAKLEAEDLDYLVAADAGDAEAQGDMGEFFLEAGRIEAGIYWLELAANQGHANSMQRLGHCYAAGTGVPKDDHLSVMWIAKAAAAGHVIALAQMKGLVSRQAG